MREKWRWILALHFLLEMCLFFSASSVTDPNDWAVLQKFIKGLTNSKLLGWNGDDPCGNSWPYLQCQGSHIIGIQVPMIGLQGTITPELNKLSLLQYLGFQFNSFSGPLPSLNGLKFLKTAYLNSNDFDTIPSDFFKGLTALTAIYLDHNPLNSSTGWVLPADIKESSQLLNLSLTNTSLSGTIPDFLGGMSSLKVLNLAYNRLSGGVPQSFSSSNLYQFQANNMAGPTLTGPIDAVGYMTSLTQLWLQVNQISGTIPVGLSNAVSLQNLKLNDNDLSGPIPDNFTQLPLYVLTLDNNQLVGRIPKFGASVKLLDLSGNNFCQDKAGADCAPEVNALLSFIGAVGYPVSIVSSWKGNDPCQSWTGVVCDASSGHVSVINLSQSKLSGTISPSLADLTYLTVLKLNDNNLTGSIPQVLTTMKYLKNVDLSNNQLTGPPVQFGDGVTVNLDGNVMLNSGNSSQTPVSSPNPNSSTSNSQAPASSSSPRTSNGTSVSGNKKKSSISVVAVAAPIAGAVSLVLVGALLFIFCKNKGNKFLRAQSPNTVLVHPRNSASDPESVKIVVNEGSVSSVGSQNDVQVVEAGNLMISIQVLRNATKNFSQDSVLGRGGFGVVYKGVLEDGTHIAVKRMESSVVSSTGLNEFQAEIAVLTKVRHRHLVALLGYCIDGNEKLLVYEYLPNGTLGQHLFEFERLNWKPLEWKRRLSIALDVARGMEYLHSLAHKSFIHRDLKPSNILLDDSFKAKVSDFGLVKLAPDGKYSVETRLAGTFGYLAPEYAVTGRVTTKSDVFSFGVVLMELLTGRRALDESQSEENLHLVTWFRRMNSNKESFGKMIDTKIEEQDDDETFQSLRTVAELAGHCTAREPYQRPDMGHAVNVLAPLVEKWKPTDMDSDDDDGIDLNLTLPQALKKWQLSENSNSSTTFDDSQASLPTLPNGFPDSFTSADGR